MDQVVGQRALSKALEIGARRDQIGAVGELRQSARLIGGGHRRLELALVVEQARSVERIARIGGKRGRGERQQRGDNRGQTAHPCDGSTGGLWYNAARWSNRGSPAEGEKGEDFDLDNFGFRVWGAE